MTSFRRLVRSEDHQRRQCHASAYQPALAARPIPQGLADPTVRESSADAPTTLLAAPLVSLQASDATAAIAAPNRPGRVGEPARPPGDALPALPAALELLGIDEPARGVHLDHVKVPGRAPARMDIRQAHPAPLHLRWRAVSLARSRISFLLRRAISCSTRRSNSASRAAFNACTAR